MSDLEKQTPGRLEFGVSITLNSKQAVELFYGQDGDKDNNKPWIVGLHTFAERLKQINFASHLDDPYADYYLLETERELISAKSKVKAIEDELSKYGKSLLNIDIGSSKKPVELVTNYSSTYANIALELLKYVDNVILQIISHRHIGVLTVEDANVYVDKVVKIMRHAFLATTGYRYTKITRDDVINKTAKHKTAFEIMKFKAELDETIINKTKRAKHAPNIKLSADEIMRRPGRARRPDRSKR